MSATAPNTPHTPLSQHRNVQQQQQFLNPSPQPHTQTQTPLSSQHKITVKVLRLTRPALQKQDLSKPEEPFNTSSDLTFSTHGLVYVGEQFSSMISVNNSADLTNNKTYNTTLSANIQLPSSEIVQLLQPDSEESTTALNPDETTQKLVTYEPKEAGLHTLTVKLIYKLADDEAALPVTFLKHYQFNATPGFSVKTKLSQLGGSDQKKDVYTIEAQIENITNATLTLETASLVPADGWQSEPFSKEESRIMSQRDVYQTAFLIQKENEEVEPSQPVGMARLGLTWRRQMGEKGTMMTGSLKP